MDLRWNSHFFWIVLIEFCWLNRTAFKGLSNWDDVYEKVFLISRDLTGPVFFGGARDAVLFHQH